MTPFRLTGLRTSEAALAVWVEPAGEPDVRLLEVVMPDCLSVAGVSDSFLDNIPETGERRDGGVSYVAHAHKTGCPNLSVT